MGAQLAGFVELFVWLLVLKQFFLPLFIIPTGSMAETLAGLHSVQTCTNCGWEYKLGNISGNWPDPICPNCRWSGDPRAAFNTKAGDRVVVHGWVHDVLPRALRRWDVVVFKDPKDGVTNFIKRLIGLPGERIELIDGDVWVNDSVATKTPEAQEALWMPYYDHDYPPKQPGGYALGSRATAYFPRFLPENERGGWENPAARRLSFDGIDRDLDALVFTTDPGGDARGADVHDFYGYNGLRGNMVLDGRGEMFDPVTDTRIGADVRFLAGGADGFVELSVEKYTRRFHARLYADGRVTLEIEDLGRGSRAACGPEVRIAAPRDRAVRFALGHADYQAVVALDGRPVLSTTPEQYSVTSEAARTNAALKPRRVLLRIGAARVRAELAHVRVDRDVHYRSGYLNHRFITPGTPPPPDSWEDSRPLVRGKRLYHTRGTGVQGNPVQLDADEYYVLGDNSPASGDSRAWSVDEIGPHLVADWQRGDYHVGTVPSDQMIGPAFLVYWPGFLPLTPWNVPLTPWGDKLLPDLGRIRWIH